MIIYADRYETFGACIAASQQGIPVLHNCERYKEIGYYYDSVENAKDQIENIVMFHEMNLDNYISKSKEILSKLNHNLHQDTYNKLLL